MSTRLGAAWLSGQGIRSSWQDARELLRAGTDPHTMANAPARHYLSATCAYDRDPELAHRLGLDEAEVVLTQGFIAGDADGDTVLLGRGGSDTSAAYFAARLGARRLEIWTDVPGMFTANPRAIPGARLLRRLRYQEAEELALMGGRVLHPRCIAPVAAHHIPIHIKCTIAPELIGTIITSGTPAGAPRIKAVSLRKGMRLFHVHPNRTLQNVGFLERCAVCFTRWNLSIDMVAASETCITFTVDPSINQIDDAVISGVLSELSALAPSKVIGPAAALSLVGNRIPAVLHELGPIFAFFEEHDVYLVTQAADAMNFTVVIGEAEADALVAELHSRLFPADLNDPVLGPPWNQLFS
jgi:bifunctional diaminopimelate decarboxylase / aspartate kinase